MDALRVSATDLDAFRYFRANDDASLGDFLAQMRRTLPQTEAMLAGVAFHAALETVDYGDHATLEADGYTFDLDFSAAIALPAIREVKDTREYLIDGCRVTLVGKVDAIRGRTVWDHKMTGRFDPERFLGSYQWRAYLDIFGADEFRWNVFEGREIGPQHYRIHSLHPMEMHRYPGMADDLHRELRLFVEMAREHLPDRIAA